MLIFFCFSFTGFSKDIVLDRANLEKIGIGPPKLISLTEARARLKENNRICESEPHLDSGMILANPLHGLLKL